MSDDEIPEEDVADYLRRHPDFLARNQELLTSLAPPSRWENGDTVVDMQQFMVGQLRREADNLRETARHVIDTSRNNMATQTRVHTAVLMLLGAGTVEDMVHVAIHTLPLPLGVDAVAFAFERGGDARVPAVLAPGMVDRLVGEDKDAVLISEFVDGFGLFSEDGGPIRSAALARLRAGPDQPPGVLGLGSRTRGTFHPRQGTELLAFLAQVAERLAYRILEAG
ncbi:MAG: DUF484 family protein [Magnetospirillum sp. WYHS-4]